MAETRENVEKKLSQPVHNLGRPQPGPQKEDRTLDEVVDFFDQGGGRNANPSPFQKLLGFTEEEQTGLVACFITLTGEPIKCEMQVAEINRVNPFCGPVL